MSDHEQKKVTEPAAGFASPASACSIPELGKPVVILEGRLDLERVPYHPPIGCTKSCDMNLKPFLCGWAWRKDGATNIISLEHFLEHMNGRYVRVTIEFEESNTKDQVTP